MDVVKPNFGKPNLGKPWPTEIRLSPDGATLTLTFEGHEPFELTAELLRVESPSAEVQGHSPTQKKLVAGKRHVKILKIDAVGNYAVKLTFDDGHASGIFTWDYLMQLKAEGEHLFAAYLANIEEQGLSRDI